VPDYTIDAHPILDAYLEGAKLCPEEVGESSLELAVGGWLDDVVHTTRGEDPPDHSRGWLVESGLFDALHAGRVRVSIS